jgi:mannose-6-phosphate isomerase-like protein (cupin superfamily)
VAPIPDLKPGGYDLNLTRVTFPAQMPSNPPHHRSGAALYYIISGTGANTVAGKTEAKAPGALIYEPFGLVHQSAVKGIVHMPCATPSMKPSSRDALLAAIAKARSWIEDIRLGRVAALTDIAEREGQVERHIRLLAPLAFLSPRIIAAIFDGTAPADLTVTALAKALSYSWAEQEQNIGLFA